MFYTAGEPGPNIHIMVVDDNMHWFAFSSASFGEICFHYS